MSTPAASMSAMRPAPTSSRGGRIGPAIGPERMLGTPWATAREASTISAVVNASSHEIRRYAAGPAAVLPCPGRAVTAPPSAAAPSNARRFQAAGRVRDLPLESFPDMQPSPFPGALTCASAPEGAAACACTIHQPDDLHTHALERMVHTIAKTPPAEHGPRRCKHRGV